MFCPSKYRNVKLQCCELNISDMDVALRLIHPTLHTQCVSPDVYKANKANRNQVVSMDFVTEEMKCNVAAGIGTFSFHQPPLFFFADGGVCIWDGFHMKMCVILLKHSALQQHLRIYINCYPG